MRFPCGARGRRSKDTPLRISLCDGGVNSEMLWSPYLCDAHGRGLFFFQLSLGLARRATDSGFPFQLSFAIRHPQWPVTMHSFAADSAADSVEDSAKSLNDMEGLLPDTLIGTALDWLPLNERRSFLSTSKSLWSKRSAYEASIRSLLLSRSPPSTVLDGFVNLYSLDLGACACDELLNRMSSESALPHLVHLAMVRSLQVTDRGLAKLVENPTRCRTLETIDITYCRRTTYGGTLTLRDKLKALRLLRRQPEWMDGHFETPFENDHLHTYWADGTFRYEREIFSSGFVSDLFEWDESSPNHVGNALQYDTLDEASSPGFFKAWPERWQWAYRPGVSVLHLPGERAVLVAQRVGGIFPPKEQPQLRHKQSVPLGQSVYLDQQGRVLDSSSRPLYRHTMISHIPVRPLETFMPPLELVERNRRVVERLRQQRVDEYDPLAVHLYNGGNENDFVIVRHMDVGH